MRGPLAWVPPYVQAYCVCLAAMILFVAASAAEIGIGLCVAAVCLTSATMVRQLSRSLEV